METLPLLVPASRDVPEEVLRDLRDSVHRRCGVLLAPVRIASAALLPALLERTRQSVAWAPACVAAALVRLGLASPMLAAPRHDRRTRSAVLVTRPAVDGLADLAGRRIGWVSRLSETGYEVPRLYLQSFGVEPEEIFASQRFYGSHDRACAALLAGEVDVIATHSGRLSQLFACTPIRVVASVGPLPSDLLVAGLDVPDVVREGVSRALLSFAASFTVGPYVLAHPREAHLALFELLGHQARDVRDRDPAPSRPGVAEAAERFRPPRFAS